MAVIKAVSSRAKINVAINYITKDEKCISKLISGINCSPDIAKEEMQTTKQLWNKTNGRTYKHFIQSFSADEQLTPEQAHQIAVNFVKEYDLFRGFEVLVATHQDREHLHTHFIVNSVNFEDGHKFQMSKQDLQAMKDLSDYLCKKQGLSITQKGQTFDGQEREETSAYNKDTYAMLKQAEQQKVKSYVFDIALAVMECKETATSREDFIQRLAEKDIETQWSDKRTNITFTDKQRQEQGESKCKVRNSKLQRYFNIDFSKESLENGFESNLREQQSNEQQRKYQNIINTTATHYTNSTTAQFERVQQNRVGEQLVKGGIGEVERELRGITQKVNSLTSEGREEQRKREQEEQRERERIDKECQEYEKQQRVAQQQSQRNSFHFGI